MQRHTRAHVREQRSKWIWKRIGQIRREWSILLEQGETLENYPRPFGSLNKMDPWDCGKTRCGICHYSGNERRDGRERLQVASELECLKQRTD